MEDPCGVRCVLDDVGPDLGIGSSSDADADTNGGRRLTLMDTHTQPHAAPPAASHWDRLPRELQDMAVDAAGVLTRWTAGRLRGPPDQLAESDRLALWADVVQTEWAGDLRQLPGCWLPPRLLWGVRSRAMLERLQALGHAGLQRGLQHAAARCGWLDALAGMPPQALADLAVQADAAALLADLVLVQRTARLTRWHAETAAALGHDGMLCWLHANMPGRWSRAVMDHAAAAGRLAMVAWLHPARPEGCSTAALDRAAANGHLDVVAWLHANTSAGCTTRAMDWAAANGHVAVLVFLHAHRTEGCTPRALSAAVRHGHDHVAAWLREHRPADVLGTV
ncbi:hypothetical protein HK105_206280 [Polyrhizophydium stewartii]|uniref:Ankyrin repeat protein n=1 Tax=Polyrhizophydium stewartii TaxID=2732419 RepID=A0ABR4N3T4_9FUNG